MKVIYTMKFILSIFLLCAVLFFNACTDGIRSGDEIANYSEEEFAQGKKGVVVVFNPSFVDKHELNCSIEVTAKIVNVIDESKIYYAKIKMTASNPAFFVGMLDPGIYYLDSILFKSDEEWSAQEASETFLQMFNSRPGIKITRKTQEKTIFKLEKFAFEVKEKGVIFLGEEKLPFYTEARNLLKTAGYNNLVSKLQPATIGESGSLVECQGENCFFMKPKKIQLLYEYKPRHWKRVDSSK